MIFIDVSHKLIAGRIKGARVTIRAMVRVVQACLVALFLSGCAPSDAPTGPSAETTAAIEALDERIADLEDDLLSETGDRSKLDARLDALGDRLDRALERLKESLEGVRTGSAEARDSAASALANAQAVASDLSVLEERYDYHLRRYHGGGG